MSLTGKGNISLSGKKILITAGPTWVPIDDVRFISNTSSGELGVLLANKAVSSGLKVDLFLGPVCRRPLNSKIKVCRYRYFDELFSLVKKELKDKNYDIILHGAAVSDYLIDRFRGKISSQKKNLDLRLSPAPKIIETIRCLNSNAFLVMFKLESGVTESVLLKRAVESMKRSGAQMAIANTFDEGRYKGFIVGSDNVLARKLSKKQLVEKLFKILKNKMGRVK